MSIQHPQENIIKTFDHMGIAVDLVEWSDTIWCGKIRYVNNNTDRPDIEKFAADYGWGDIPGKINSKVDDYGWQTKLHVNYLSNERPSGVMMGVLVATDDQPKSYDVYKIPATRFLRIRVY